MTNGWRHSSHLSIATLVNLKLNPEIGNAFSHSHRRITRRHDGLGIKNSGVCRKSEFSIKKYPGFHLGKRLG
jgi:hypothetical protein